ncbi:MAG TPA: VOC family protein [Chloroflexota bacterium]|nr:VOC family protein [Chloroflexota bacterium]
MVKVIGVCHVGIAAKEPAVLAAFYREVMGMTVVGGSSSENAQFGASAFLSNRPDDENHELVFFADPYFKHTAFKVATLAELRAFYRTIKERDLPIKMALNHGCSLAFYFDDPEGNMIEVYWPTNVHSHQPYGDPIDLDASEDELLRDVERVARLAGPPIAGAGAVRTARSSPGPPREVPG